MLRILLILLALAPATTLRAQAVPDPATVFGFMLAKSGDAVAIHLDVAPGFALYRDKVELHAEGGQVIDVRLPEGTASSDPFMGETFTVTGESVIRARLRGGGGPVTLFVGYMGCKIDVFCYPPQHLTFDLGVL